MEGESTSASRRMKKEYQLILAKSSSDNLNRDAGCNEHSCATSEVSVEKDDSKSYGTAATSE